MSCRHALRRAVSRGALLSYLPPNHQLRSLSLASHPLRHSIHANATLQARPVLCARIRTFTTSPPRNRDDEPSVLDTAKESVENAASSVKETASDAVDGVRDWASPPKPTSTLYVGNLYFETTPESLQELFSKQGEVTQSKIVYDGRGLSKGFGYITFSSVEEATKAQAALHQQEFEGRRMQVQYARERSTNPILRNPPAKTVFIGNMSFEMSDKDLNDLFREIKNVLDVRVAIDRKTGQPRGFAHADFKDVESAENAVKVLQSREFYGRKLRVDYSSARSDMPRNPEPLEATNQ